MAGPAEVRVKINVDALERPPRDLYEECADLVVAIAAGDTPCVRINDKYIGDWLCGVCLKSAWSTNTIEHTPECWWRRAREIMSPKGGK